MKRLPFASGPRIRSLSGKVSPGWKEEAPGQFRPGHPAHLFGPAQDRGILLPIGKGTGVMQQGHDFIIEIVHLWPPG